MINLDLIFSMITVLILMTYFIYYIDNTIDKNRELSENIAARNLIDHVSYKINKVQIMGESTNGSYSLEINLPNKIKNEDYSLTVNKSNLILEFKGKKGKSDIIQNKIDLEDFPNDYKIILKPGNSYLIESKLDEDSNRLINFHKI